MSFVRGTASTKPVLETRPLPRFIRIPKEELNSLKEEFDRYYEFEKNRLLSDKSLYEAIEVSDLSESLNAKLEEFAPIAENVLNDIISLSESI